jgi:hypothetical protein
VAWPQTPLRVTIQLPVGSLLEAGTCYIANATCLGDTRVELYANTGELVAVNDDGAFPECGQCSFMSFTTPTQRRRLATTQPASYVLLVSCTMNTTCSWYFQYRIVAYRTVSPPPSLPPPALLGTDFILRCFSQAAVAPYDGFRVQIAQEAVLMQLAEYVRGTSERNDVIALLLAGPNNATSVAAFLRQIVNATQEMNVTLRDACAPQGSVVSISVLSFGGDNLSLSTLDGVRMLSSLVFNIASMTNLTLLPTAQAAVVDILTHIAQVGPYVTMDVAQCTTSTLSTVVNNALLTANYDVLPSIPPVLDLVAQSESAQLAALNLVSASAMAIVTISPFISTYVQSDPRRVTAGTEAGWGVPSHGLLVPSSCACQACTDAQADALDSPSFFDLAGITLLSAPVIARYFALGFDPYVAEFGMRVALPGSAGAHKYNTTGVSRLVLANAFDGSIISVNNLTSPIRFRMPAVDTADNAQAICAFWNATTEAYSTAGVATLPDPRPPHHTLSFPQQFIVQDDASVAQAWAIDGPLFDDNCTLGYLNCLLPENERLTIWHDGAYHAYPHNILYLDPLHPLDAPAVACPGTVISDFVGTVSEAATTAVNPVLRVYYGGDCKLWQPNAFNCTWDAVKQAFIGGGCIASEEFVTQCMTRHVRARIICVLPPDDRMFD